MIINFSLIRLIFIISFFLFFPFVQKQWLNLYLFNTKDFSFYLLLYYISGLCCPIIVIHNSLNKFTKYKFNNSIINLITGKSLLIFTFLTLIPLSVIFTIYLFINIDLILNLFYDRVPSLQLSNIQIIFIISIVSIFLIFKKSRIFIKKVSLFNFLNINLILWHAEINKIVLSDELFLKK